MTDPQPSCPRCHLYLSARGCTPERCANPEGAAELEKLTKAPVGSQRHMLAPPSDLDMFRAMLDRAGIDFVISNGIYDGNEKAPGFTVLVDGKTPHDGTAMARFRPDGSLKAMAGTDE